MATKPKETKQESKNATEIRAISWTRVFGPLTVEKIAETGKITMCKVVGEVSGIHRGNNDNGEWACFEGEFAATNLETGEIFIASRAFIPGARGENMMREYNAQLRIDVRSKMQFAVEIYAVVRESDPEKFDVEAHSLIESKFANKALAMLAKV